MTNIVLSENAAALMLAVITVLQLGTLLLQLNIRKYMKKGGPAGPPGPTGPMGMMGRQGPQGEKGDTYRG